MGLITRAKTWISGETLVDVDLNGEFNNILDNLIPNNIDDASANAAAMQATADPYPAGVESLATNLLGELQRLRYVLAQITGRTYWYYDPNNSLLNTGTYTVPTVAVDTISEKTSANGVAIDGLTIKDGGISDGTNSIFYKIINIGDWDMSSTAVINVAHGYAIAAVRRIKSITGIIRNDADNTYYTLHTYNPTAGRDDGNIESVDATNVVLNRGTGGTFETTDFDATSYNRGWLFVTLTAS